MTGYTNLLERLAVSAGGQECLYADAKAAIEDLQVRLAESEDTNKALRVRLGSELERANELVADLQAECSELRGMAGAMDMLRSEMIDSGVIDINVPPMFFSESVIPRLLRLADMEKQEPVAWLDRSTEERPGDTVWLPDDLQGMSTRGLVPLYAAPPVITQHEPVTTVEDRYNADGKSCHITDDLPPEAADAIAELVARVAYLESRLEISPEHDIDGIAARDATIKLQDGRIAELEANRADLAKQALVAWDSGEEWEPLAFCLCAEENGLDSCHELIWEGYPPEPWGERWQKYEREAKRMIDLVSQYAAPPVITQHEPVTTVEDRYNADGKSCHITDDLPAGMKLYAAPPVAAPVRLTDEQAEKVDEAIREALGDAYDCLRVWNAWSYGTMGPDDFSQVAEDSDRVAEIRNAAAVALGFKLEGEQ